jgi:hypothetical protein
MPSSHRHCISLLAIHQKGEAGKVDDALSSQTLQKPASLHFSSFQGLLLYTCVLLISESLLLQCQVFLMCYAVVSLPNLNKDPAKVCE